jgi:hypothetical protein
LHGKGSGRPTSADINRRFLAEKKGLASKQALPEPLSPVAKNKQPKAKPQPSAAEQTPSAATPELLDSNEIPCGPCSVRKAKPQPSAAEQTPSAATPELQDSNEVPCGPGSVRVCNPFEALQQQKLEALPHRRAAKVFGCHPQARTGMSHVRDEWPISVSKAEKELMAAVARNDVKRAEKLLSEFGPSLMSGFGSLAILQFARDNLGSNFSQSNKMCELILAQGEVPKQGFDIKKEGGLVKHAGKELLGKTFKDGHKQLCFDADLRKLNVKEKPAGARLGRSASVPHIWANISYPVTVPKRSVSNARTRRKPIYQPDV